MKIIKGIGIAILLLVLLLVSIGVWTWYKSSKYEETAVPYVTKAIYDISEWNLESMKSYLAPEVMKEVSDSDLKKILNGLSKMGKLLHLEEPQFLSISSQATTKTGSGTFISYKVPAKYEKGDATLNIILKEVGEGRFIIYKFNLDSLALFE